MGRVDSSGRAGDTRPGTPETRSGTPDTGAAVPSDGGSTVAAKAALRARLLAARRTLPAEVRADAAARIQAPLRTLLGRHPRRTVAGYVPVSPEPGGSELPAVLATTLGPGGRLLLPVLRPDLDLDWAVYSGALVPAGRRLREPPGPLLGPGAIAAAALVLAPAVAVDRRGVRLGRGGGSYDRALARAGPGAYVVALLHDGELLDADLPAEPHDRLVSAVITPADGLVALRGNPGSPASL